MLAATLQVDVRTSPGHADGPCSTTMAVSGELDIYSAPTFTGTVLEHLSAHPVGDLQECVFDLGGVSFIDSTGLGALIRLRRRIVADGGVVRLVVPATSTANTLFRITGLDRVMDVRPSLDPAV